MPLRATPALIEHLRGKRQSTPAPAGAQPPAAGSPPGLAAALGRLDRLEAQALGLQEEIHGSVDCSLARRSLEDCLEYDGGGGRGGAGH